MTKGAVGESLQKGQKRERSSNEKMPRNWQKRERKSAAAQSKNAEMSARKALKIRKMSPTEHSKMLRKYKFWIYYRIYLTYNEHLLE